MLVIGSVNVDLGLRIDRLPSTGQTITAASTVEAPGGKGVDQALAAARLDSRTGLLAAAGPDAASVLEPLRDAADLAASRHGASVGSLPASMIDAVTRP
ncbi:hypothetical protein ABGB18_08585 [Nonomuraea sp. B12E4]|uniref:PfkB family carbohydrate kinase n=1 Tax=Nonomuraea sp. B12E4 TaxID=3153564 RepID=UPI00325F38AA